MLNVSRRDFLAGSATVVAVASLPRLAAAQAFAPAPGPWRQFRLETRIEIAKPDDHIQAWVPLPAFSQPDWLRPGDSTWNTNAISAQIMTDRNSGAQMLALEWTDGKEPAVVEIVSTVATRDRAVDLTTPGYAPSLSSAERQRYLAATRLVPTDGIVKTTSDKITAQAGSDLEKARAIYEWIVENTYRKAATRGCGTGDIASLLQSGDLGGKCADLNALFVGLLRSSGVPARDVYGLRIAPSRFGYKSLGANSDVVSKTQHCRAEVYLAGFGWVPMDPADVRKVMLEEPPGNLPIDDIKVVAARKALFGAWEGNWLAYNDAHDVALPGATGPQLGFLMYPQAEVATIRQDCLDPDKFKYTITSTEIAV